jgi:hydrogenase maturation protein HypF
VLALQGVGGFQLLVDATNPAAVNRLRRRKGRPAKPFALLLADLAAIEPWVQLSAVERSLLSAAAAPIVLLRRLRADSWEAVAPGSPALGVMLPASPLHQLLAKRFGKPLVCTSGNRSGEPLCTDPSEALQRLSGLADAFLVHNRAIARPLDDSVLQLIDGEPALLRRARGYAPQALDLLPPPIPPPQANLLALGGDLKSAPALALGPRVWLAPHLGDLVDPRTHARFQGGIDELLRRHGEPLERIALDPHPGHLAGVVARSLAPSKVGVQHHLAHALAVVAERGLALPLLAFCADGLGYGEPQDAAAGGDAPLLWGGELLKIQAGGVQRLASLRPLALPGGERAMVEPRRVALGLLVEGGPNRLAHPGAHHTLAAFSAAERDGLLAAMARGINTPFCSSLGRLFDGVASLLGLCQQLSFEGEGGLRLQGAAAQAAADSGAYPLPLVPAMEARAAPPWLGRLDWDPLLEALLGDIASGNDPAHCAARFHNGVAQGLADLVALAQGSGPPLAVVLAGGCFQNALLLERCIAALRQRGLEPHWARTVPTNDGGLALGQIWASRLELTRINPGL